MDDYIDQPKRRLADFLIFFVMLVGVTVFFVFNALSDVDAGVVEKTKYYKYPSGLAADGYDVVAYFEEAKAVKGKQAFETNLDGQLWHFSSLENRERFLSEPSSYLPKYGGHCAYAVAQDNGYLAYGDPKAWSIRDGVLYFNYNKNIRNAWLSNADAFIATSEKNWPILNSQ